MSNPRWKYWASGVNSLLGLGGYPFSAYAYYTSYTSPSNTPPPSTHRAGGGLGPVLKPAQNAFQSNAFQETFGHVAFQEAVYTGGAGRRQEEEVSKPWRYKAGIDTVYRHIAAVHLGRKGGYAKSNSR